MRSKSVALWFVGSAFVLVALQFWILVIVSRWIIEDSHTLHAFPAAHPVLGFVVTVLWTVGDFGGVVVLLLALAGLFWWFTRHSGHHEHAT
jgi:hypothetical protein